MLRRERSYEGIAFQAKTVPVDREVADNFSAAMRAIKDFDRAKQKAVKAISNEAKALGEEWRDWRGGSPEYQLHLVDAQLH